MRKKCLILEGLDRWKTEKFTVRRPRYEDLSMKTSSKERKYLGSLLKDFLTLIVGSAEFVSLSLLSLSTECCSTYFFFHYTSGKSIESKICRLKSSRFWLIC